MTIERHVKACRLTGTSTKEVGPGHRQQVEMTFEERHGQLYPELFPFADVPFLVSRELVVETPDRLRVSIFELKTDTMSDVETKKEIVLERDEINKRQDILKVGGFFERLIGRKVTYSWRSGR